MGLVVKDLRGNKQNPSWKRLWRWSMNQMVFGERLSSPNTKSTRMAGVLRWDPTKIQNCSGESRIVNPLTFRINPLQKGNGEWGLDSFVGCLVWDQNLASRFTPLWNCYRWSCQCGLCGGFQLLYAVVTSLIKRLTKFPYLGCLYALIWGSIVSCRTRY